MSWQNSSLYVITFNTVYLLSINQSINMIFVRCALRYVQEIRTIKPRSHRRQRGRCRNIKGEPQIFGSCHSLSHAHFSSGCCLWWALANSRCMPNLKSLVPAVAEILQGNSKISRNFPSPRPPLLFPLGVIL